MNEIDKILQDFSNDCIEHTESIDNAKQQLAKVIVKRFESEMGADAYDDGVYSHVIEIVNELMGVK